MKHDGQARSQKAKAEDQRIMWNEACAIIRELITREWLSIVRMDLSHDHLVTDGIRNEGEVRLVRTQPVRASERMIHIVSRRTKPVDHGEACTTANSTSTNI